MSEIAGQQWYGFLTAGHGLLGAVLFFALVAGSIFLFASSEPSWRYIRNTGAVAALAYLGTYFFGWLAYPVFRVGVRAAYLDSATPAATGIFEIKEHLASIGAFVAIAVLLLALFGRLPNASRYRREAFGSLFASLALLSVAVLLLGFVLKAFL